MRSRRRASSAADSYIVPGETIRPRAVDGDRRGYVIAIGDSGEEALARADAAAALVEWRST